MLNENVFFQPMSTLMIAATEIDIDLFKYFYWLK